MDHPQVEAKKRQVVLMRAIKVAARDVRFQVLHNVALWKRAVHFPLPGERPVQPLCVTRGKTGALHVE